MDPISLAVGAGILTVGLLAGHISGRAAAARQRPVPPPEAKPICGCTHHRSMHADGGKGECMVAIPRESYSPQGKYLGKQPHPCACQQYVGPEPYPTIWPIPMLTEGSEQ